MINHNSVQEILLLQNTRFLLRTLLEQQDIFEKNFSNSGDPLRDACWNGLVHQILPECFDPALSRRLYLWHIHNAVEFISLNYGTSSPDQDECLCLNPHIFLRQQILN